MVVQGWNLGKCERVTDWTDTDDIAAREIVLVFFEESTESVTVKEKLPKQRVGLSTQSFYEVDDRHSSFDDEGAESDHAQGKLG